MSIVRLQLIAAGLIVSLAGCGGALPECRCQDKTVAGCQPAQAVERPQIDYLLVEMTSGMSAGAPHKVEISPTPAYATNREKVRSAAIRLPDFCSNEGVGQVTGDARGAGDSIVKTKCGTWLAELEKALAQANFRVVSWDSLSGLITSKNIPAHVAAKELGADVLFIFNSIEAVNITPGSEHNTRFLYSTSDATGKRGAPFPLSDNEHKVLADFVGHKVKTFGMSDDKAVIAIASMLDSTAVLTATGESVWFYRNATKKPMRNKMGARFLFAKYKGAWYPASRDILLQPTVETQSYSSEYVTTGSVSAMKDPYDAERLELIRASAVDFVTRFRNGQPGD